LEYCLPLGPPRYARVCVKQYSILRSCVCVCVRQVVCVCVCVCVCVYIYTHFYNVSYIYRCNLGNAALIYGLYQTRSGLA
jgi:hypothetical protein